MGRGAAPLASPRARQANGSVLATHADREQLFLEAGRRVVELARAIDPAAVVAELGRRQPACTRFAVAKGGAAFVGASPERLVRKRGRVVDSEALAGSCARTGDDAAAAAALAASAKDRAEHAWVVAAIEAQNVAKAKLLYDVLDGSNGFFAGHAQKEDRSLMNVTFRAATPALDAPRRKATTSER